MSVGYSWLFVNQAAALMNNTNQVVKAFDAQ